MPQPTPYSRKFDFTGFSAAQPSSQPPGVQFDAEYNAIKVTLDAILSNLVRLQRDDGAPKNGIVTLDTLAADVLTTLGGGSNWTPKGAWATATVYAVGNVVATGGTTYVCAVAHTAGTFATDLAANRWVAIFGTVTSTVGDGSVTTPKIVDGAVTAAKLGFTALDLTGTLRGQGGLAAGTAIAGAFTITGKAASGDAYLSIARTTISQGMVGLRLDGGASGSVWEIRQTPGATALSLYNSLGALTTATFNMNGTVDWAATQRVTGWIDPSSGAGLEYGYYTGTGIIRAFDRSASAWRPLQISGLTVAIQQGGVTVATANAGSFDITEGTVAGQALGYRNIPRSAYVYSSYTLALSDSGRFIFTAGSTAGQAITIPSNAALPFPVGTMIVLINRSSANWSVNINTDFLYLAGTATGGSGVSRTLAPWAQATLFKTDGNEWFISGPGVS